MLKTLVSVFLLGMAFGSGACLTSCGPMMLSYSIGSEKKPVSALCAYGLFSLSRIAVYVVIGSLIYGGGKVIAEQFLAGVSQWLLFIGGAFVAVLGVLTLATPAGGDWWARTGACRFLTRHLINRDVKSILLMGLIIGALPCAPLIAFFGYMALVSKTWVGVMLYSLSFGVGTSCSPLPLLMVISGFVPKALIRDNERIRVVVRRLCGIILIVLGAQLIWQGI